MGTSSSVVMNDKNIIWKYQIPCSSEQMYFQAATPLDSACAEAIVYTVWYCVQRLEHKGYGLFRKKK